MPLWLLAIAVPLGIALVVWLVKRTGGDASPIFADLARTIALIETEFSGSRVLMIKNGENGHAAVFKLVDGQVGLMRQVGRNHVTRLVAPIGIFNAGHDQRPAIGLNDPGFPAIKLEFTSGAEAREFLQKLKN